MSYAAPAVTTAGLTIPTYQEILDDLVSQAQAIWGPDIYLGADSQDYQFISIFAAKVNDCMQLLQLVYNNRGPGTAIGSALDSIVKLNGLARLTATYSTCTVTLSGTAGTTITNGLAQDTSGYQWAIPSPTVIGTGGTVIVTATCTQSGPIAANAGQISLIVTPTYGWTSVTNAAAATVGTAAETDSELKSRQGYSTAQPSQTVLEGIEGAIAAVSGVTRFIVDENDTSSTNANGNPPHSVTAVVDGGADADVANAIWVKKAPGALANGSVQITMTDSYGQQTIIGFDRPTNVPIDVTVNVKQLAGYTTATTSAIQTADVSYLNGLALGSAELSLSGLWGAALAVMPSLTSPTFSITGVTAARDTGGATLTSALSSGTAYTSLDVPALTVPIPSGMSLTLTSGSNAQIVTASSAAAIGATSIPVTSFNANFAYPTGTTVTGTQGTADIALAFGEATEGIAANVTVIVS